MIVKDEEKTLFNCLESIAPWVDEIIIIDTGSKDGTKRIAEKFTRNVLDFLWIDDFSAARNESIRHATGEWIFWLDADDTVPAETGSSLRTLAAGAGNNTGGYSLKIHLPSVPGEIGIRHVSHVKLFKNLPEYRFTGRIHEQIANQIIASKKIILETDLVINHSGHDFTPEGQRIKREREARILEQEIKDSPNYAFNWFNLAMAQFQLLNYQATIESFRKFFTLLPNATSSVDHQAYYYLSIAYEKSGDLLSAQQTAKDGLERCHNDPGLQFQYGDICLKLEEYQEAENHFRRALAPRNVYPDGFEMKIIDLLIPFDMGVLKRKTGLFSEAARYFETLLSLYPAWIPALCEACELAAIEGNESRLTTHFESLRQVSPIDAETVRQTIAKYVDLPFPA